MILENLMLAFLNYYQPALSGLPAVLRMLAKELLTQAACTTGEYPDAADPNGPRGRTVAC